jgi:pimeloyl-ACP methyl ester carboxylesterase
VTVAVPAPTIVFCHANGFVAGTYGALLDAWRAAGWRVLAPKRLGHDPLHPVTSGWPHLRDELLAFVAAEAADAPVALVGHSMGGYLNLLAASRRPALVQAVVLLDAPIVAGWRSHTFHMLKLSGLIERAGPGRIARRRRTHWPSAEAVRGHFEAKKAFALWDRRVFEDYLRHGFEPDPAGGMTLAFRREAETRIYNTLPHHVPDLLRRHPLRCPVAFVGGTRSAENRQLGLAFARRLAGERWRWIEGTHLFPMEKPDETAGLVLELLGELTVSPRTAPAAPPSPRA